MSRAGTPATGDLVPLDERLRYLRLLRVILAGAAVSYGALLRTSLHDPLWKLGVMAGAYIGVTLATEGVWLLLRRRLLLLFGWLLILDGAFLAGVTYETGGGNSPARYLFMLHLSAVALLASYRTGIKLALWDSLLLFVTFYAQKAGILATLHGKAATEEYRRNAAFIVAFWALTLLITTLSAVNERELRRRRVDLEALAVMGHRLEDAAEPTSVGEVLLEALVEGFGYARSALFDGPDRGSRLITCRGLSDAVVSDFQLADDSVLQVAARERRTLLVRDLDPAADPWLTSVMPDAANLIVVPLVAEARVVGVLVAESPHRASSRMERRVVATTERFTAHAALALRNAVLLERMAEMAATDGLTQLANRRSFDEALERDVARAVRSDGRLSVVLIDIDHFKRLNDTHGHLVGDNVLRQVAATLREHGREYDTVARYGGEEFAVVLPGVSQAVAMQVAERLRESIEESETDVPVTASCGVATFPYDAKDGRELLAAADRGLYSSKRAGRNKVTAASAAVAAPPRPSLAAEQLAEAEAVSVNEMGPVDDRGPGDAMGEPAMVLGEPSASDGARA